MSGAKPGTTMRQKEVLAVLDPVDWKSTPDISTWTGIDVSSVSNMLKSMQKAGLVEKMFDGTLGKTYWKLPGGEQFHKASEEVKA